MDLRSILDWSIAPRLKEAPGVVEVNSYGGELKTYQVALRPDALVAYGISLKDVFNVIAAGARIVALQRLEGDLRDVGDIVVGSQRDVPIVLQIAMADRPDLRARDYEIRRIAADIDLIRRLIVPNPVISGFVQRIADSPGNFIRVAGGTVGISVPLFDRVQAELTVLHGQKRRASYERAATNLTVEQQVRDSIVAYDAARWWVPPTTC